MRDPYSTSATNGPAVVEQMTAEVAESGLRFRLDRDEVCGVLDSDAYAEAVRADEDERLRLGLTGVPLFLVDCRFALAGAQPASVILRTLHRAWQDSHDPITVTGDGQACGPQGCTS